MRDAMCHFKEMYFGATTQTLPEKQIFHIVYVFHFLSRRTNGFRPGFNLGNVFFGIQNKTHAEWLNKLFKYLVCIVWLPMMATKRSVASEHTS